MEFQWRYGVSALLIGGALASPVVTAQQLDQLGSQGFQWLASLGLTAGGDDLVTVEYKHTDFEDELEAGGLIYLGAGASYRFQNAPFSLRAVGLPFR